LYTRRLAGRVSITAVDTVCIVLGADVVWDCLAVLRGVRRLSVRADAAVVEGSLQTMSGWLLSEGPSDLLDHRYLIRSLPSSLQGFADTIKGIV
jgi:hypothetical protein